MIARGYTCRMPLYIGLTWRIVGSLVIAGLVVGLILGFLAGRAVG